jgi:hypothetical protein
VLQLGGVSETSGYYCAISTKNAQSLLQQIQIDGSKQTVGSQNK